MGMSVVLAVVCGVLAGHWRHTVGLAPMLAGLLCASCFLRRRDVAVVGIGAMLVHDLVAGISWFTLVRLIGIVGVIGIVWALRVRPSLKSLLLGLGLSSSAYHVVLAVGDVVTQTCTKAPLTFQGLVSTVTSSLPYFQRSLLADLVFTSAFLLVYTLAGYLVVLRWPAALPKLSKA